jgi:copper chaperone CopZ
MRRVIKISDMKCDGCVTTIEQYIQGNEGVNNAVGNLEDKEVMVDFDEKTISILELKKLIRQAGYTPGKTLED